MKTLKIVNLVSFDPPYCTLHSILLVKGYIHYTYIGANSWPPVLTAAHTKSGLTYIRDLGFQLELGKNFFFGGGQHSKLHWEYINIECCIQYIVLE